jgi:hypothetical protein
MNTPMRRFLLVSVLAASGLLAGDSLADNHSQRQYYGSWQKHPQGYSYRSYYYKPSPTYSGYKHHYVIHHPKKPDHFYYYNPYQKQFWGRCPVAAQGKPVYSKLADKDKNADLNKIPEAAFPAPAGLPPIPESTDGATLDLPPDDLPGAEELPT